MGTRAFSHDSIFIPDGGAESEQTVQAMSQDNILGKVKTLQVRQLESQRHRKGEGGGHGKGPWLGLESWIGKSRGNSR